MDSDSVACQKAHWHKAVCKVQGRVRNEDKVADHAQSAGHLDDRIVTPSQFSCEFRSFRLKFAYSSLCSEAAFLNVARASARTSMEGLKDCLPRLDGKICTGSGSNGGTCLSNLKTIGISLFFFFFLKVVVPFLDRPVVY